MRILYFTRDYTPHDHRFLSALAASPHTIYSLRMERRGRQLEDRPLPVEVTQIPWAGGQSPARWFDYPRLVRDLLRVIKEVQPDVIHAGSIQTAAFLTALADFKPLVSMSWGSDLLMEADRSAWMRWVTHYTLAHTTVLAADCDVVRKKAASFGFPPDRVVLFPWGVDLQTFSPASTETSELRARQGWDQAFVVLSLRSWEPLYGVDVLVRGFARAARQEPRLRLILLGGGSQAKLLREIVNEQGVADQVFFGGQATNHQLPDYYRAADLYISASHSDGSSVSLMEALACGRVVLLSDIPANREWVTPGREGWFFSDGDDQDLTEKLLQAVQQQRLPEMGQAARALAETRANWVKNFQQLLWAYELAVRLQNPEPQDGRKTNLA